MTLEWTAESDDASKYVCGTQLTQHWLTWLSLQADISACLSKVYPSMYVCVFNLAWILVGLCVELGAAAAAAVALTMGWL